MEQEKMGCLGRKQESKFNQECGPTFCVIGEAQILCFAWLYTGASNVPPRDQVEASF